MYIYSVGACVASTRRRIDRPVPMFGSALPSSASGPSSDDFQLTELRATRQLVRRPLAHLQPSAFRVTSRDLDTVCIVVLVCVSMV